MGEDRTEPLPGDDAATHREQDRGDNREVSAASGWVTTQQAARALDVTARTVRWHIERGNLEARPEGEGVRRTWLISIDSLQAFRDSRRAAGEAPGGYRAAARGADVALDIPGNPIRELADRLVEEASRASEFRVRLELSERAQSTLEEELREERRRREEAEREREDLRRELEALREPPGGRESSGPTRTPTDAGGDREATTERLEGQESRGGEESPRRSWWREFFGF